MEITLTVLGAEVVLIVELLVSVVEMIRRITSPAQNVTALGIEVVSMVILLLLQVQVVELEDLVLLIVLAKVVAVTVVV